VLLYVQHICPVCVVICVPYMIMLFNIVSSKKCSFFLERIFLGFLGA
jgi:hypothetical protein